MLRVLSSVAATLVFASALGAAPGNSTPESRKGPQDRLRTLISQPGLRKVRSGRPRGTAASFSTMQTASGEPYDMNDFTAAHRTLPLGSWVKVTDLKTGRVGGRPH